jgi:hypothetical protein
MPYSASENEAGTLAETVVFEGDIVSPLGNDDWEASR